MFILTENLGNMVPDVYYSMYNFSHPPLVERLRALKLTDGALSTIKIDKKDTKKTKWFSDNFNLMATVWVNYFVVFAILNVIELFLFLTILVD